MNLLGLTDAQRIVFLKGVILGMGMASTITIARALWVVASFDERNKKLRKITTLQMRVIGRFVDLVPEEICAKINEEFGFDFVTVDLDL